jgi:Mg-chelatase subunit ChlD
MPAAGRRSTTPANKLAAIAAVQGLQPDTWTCLREGLRAVLEMAARATARRRAVILMSDGKAACPGTDFVSYREQILAEALTLNPRRIPIHTLAIGSDVDDSLLRALSDRSGGRYRRLVR